jgi:D-alanyl-D-alanine carboxypeptidase (penicillin-binding protein 5/6)
MWLAAAGPVTAAAPERLNARAVALLDASSGQLLYGEHANQAQPIASATKLMTALVTLEHARLNAVFADPNFSFAPQDSQIGLVPGERMTVHDLLLALLLPSADDAAQDLAYNVGHRSVAAFIAMMNARARQLGLFHTHYSTPIGLDTPGNYSTAADLVRLARYDLNTQPFLRHAVGLPRALLVSGSHPRTVLNRNDLVGRVPWMTGVKTGHTRQAGYVLVGSATRGSMTLISAVLGTPSVAQRDAATLALLNWGFSEFTLRTPVHAGMVVARPRVRYRPRMLAAVVAASSYTHVYARGQVVTTSALVPRQLNGPKAAGARVGTLVVQVDGSPTARIPLVLAHPLAHYDAPLVWVAPVAGAITLVSVILIVGFVASRTRIGSHRKRARAAEGSGR